jgi:hypothetical protein
MFGWRDGVARGLKLMCVDVIGAWWARRGSLVV